MRSEQLRFQEAHLTSIQCSSTREVSILYTVIAERHETYPKRKDCDALHQAPVEAGHAHCGGRCDLQYVVRAESRGQKRLMRVSPCGV